MQIAKCKVPISISSPSPSFRVIHGFCFSNRFHGAFSDISGGFGDIWDKSAFGRAWFSAGKRAFGTFWHDLSRFSVFLVEPGPRNLSQNSMRTTKNTKHTKKRGCNSFPFVSFVCFVVLQECFEIVSKPLSPAGHYIMFTDVVTRSCKERPTCRRKCLCGKDLGISLCCRAGHRPEPNMAEISP